jgi:hypothetical protein
MQMKLRIMRWKMFNLMNFNSQRINFVFFNFNCLHLNKNCASFNSKFFFNVSQFHGCQCLFRSKLSSLFEKLLRSFNPLINSKKIMKHAEFNQYQFYAIRQYYLVQNFNFHPFEVFKHFGKTILLA